MTLSIHSNLWGISLQRSSAFISSSIERFSWIPRVWRMILLRWNCILRDRVLHTPEYCEVNAIHLRLTVCQESIYTVASWDASMQNGILLQEFPYEREYNNHSLQLYSETQTESMLFNITGRTYICHGNWSIIMYTVIWMWAATV